MRLGWRSGLAVGAAMTVVGLAPARGEEPPAPSQPIYGIQPPTADPARQQHTIIAADGTEIFVETWLPATNGDDVPPEQLPVIVSISPYLGEGVVESEYLLQTMVPRGYAYANAHVRGTGLSGGCIDLFGPNEADDSSFVIEYLGRDAPFSDGHVGAFGISYPGGTPLSVAGRGDPARTHYLDAIVVGAPYHSMHEAQWMFDGVPSWLISQGTALSYGAVSLGLGLDLTWTPPPLERIPDRLGCVPMHVLNTWNPSGTHTPWHRDRDNRAWTDRIDVPTFVTHGHADLRPVGGSPPSIEVGLFDQLPATTPKFGMFGVFGHSRPPGDDFTARMIAWYDEYLRGVDTDVDSWPTAMVQGNDGAWRGVADWPLTGDPQASLALGPNGTLGAAEPATGSTQYLEALFETTLGFVPGTFAIFETAPLAERLELTGQPVLDLWVSLGLPDAHIAARIDTFDASGAPIPNGYTYGLRSARHLEPYDHGRFVQHTPVVPPTGVPINIPVRFQPTDLVVPAGGRIRITIAGSLIVNAGLSQVGVPESILLGPSMASGWPTPVTILHDPAHPSALEFLRPPN